MKATKEKILLTALALFAQKGYEAVSVSDIAGELGMTKSSLYKHYENKRAIFDCILAQMEQNDAVNADEYSMPEGSVQDEPEKYGKAELENCIAYAKSMLRYWTENPFASAFRRMLTLEQYRNEEQSMLYQQYIGSGPVEYMTDVFASVGIEDAVVKAVEFYAPMFLAYSMYDASEDKRSVLLLADTCIDRCGEKLIKELSERGNDIKD